ncbi:hypothetical protein [Nakamurella lactea]|uniref:hypothetical protein n=1 Tax=Nakamurella lactea TaxID=459515 RepID=UPI00048F403B|nr:hypothetical protein [Nakamurella lactea]
MKKPGEPTAEEVVAKLDPKAQQRYRRLLDDKDLLFVFHSVETLAEYCLTGDTALYSMYQRQPTTEPNNRLPAPKYGSGNKYESSRANLPIYMEIEQTPYHGGSVRPPAQVVGKERLDTLSADVAKNRRKESGMNVDPRPTTNVFQYELQLTFRITPMEHTEWGWRELIDQETNGLEVLARSPMYQSSGKAMPKGDTSKQTSSRAALTPVEIGDEVRGGVQQAAVYAKQFDQFKPTLPWTHQERGGKLDLSLANQKDPSVKGGYTIASGSLSSLCFHSEPQALGATTRELPPIITELVEKLLARADKTQRPAALVFNSLQVFGASNPNTVCGNACKPALAKLLDIITDRFDAAIAGRRDALLKEGIIVRPSHFFRAHMSVGAPEEFGGYGTGAIEIDAMVQPKHGVVTEFPPGILMKDNQKLKDRKEKREKAKALKAAKTATPQSAHPQGTKTTASQAQLKGHPSKRQKKDHT